MLHKKQEIEGIQRMRFKPDPETFYTLGEIEKEGVANIQTLRRWVNSGQLTGAKVGKGYMVKGSSLIDFMITGTDPRKG